MPCEGRPRPRPSRSRTVADRRIEMKQIFRAEELAEKDGRRAYPIDDCQETIKHFVTRRTDRSNPFGPHKHDGEEFWFILEGEAIVGLGGEDHVVRKGDLVVLPPWQEHGLRSEKGAYWICFG